MNERNVHLLMQLLMDTTAECRKNHIVSYHDHAALLAARGVLVPSALTAKDAWTLGGSVDGTTMTSEEAVRLVVILLERIAKGEA